jgi:hypothetical protein
MKPLFLTAIAALLLATGTAHASDLNWDKLRAETIAQYGDCNFDLSISGRSELHVSSTCKKDGRVTFGGDTYLSFTEFKNRERYHNGEKLCPRPLRVDDVERVNRVTFTVFTSCEETKQAYSVVFKLEGDTLHIFNNTSF